MKKLMIALGLTLAATTASADFFDFGGDDGEWKMGPYGPYWDENDWPEWTPMYWAEEFADEMDDDDDEYYGPPPGYGYGGGYGPPPGYGYGGGYGGGYGPAPYGPPASYGPPAYSMPEPPAPPAAPEFSMPEPPAPPARPEFNMPEPPAPPAAPYGYDSAPYDMPQPPMPRY